MAQDQSNSQSILKELMAVNEQRVAALEKQSLQPAALDFEQQFADISQKFDQAAQLSDERERTTRLRVLEGTFETLRKEAQTEEKDLSEAVFALNGILEAMGMEYSKIGEFTPEEKALIANAEQALQEAQSERQEADGAWLFKAGKIAEAEQEIAQAKERIADAKTEAARRARQRLLSANIEQSLQEFMLRVEKTIRIMENRMREIDGQLQSVTARKAEAFQIREAAARALDQLDRELNEKEAELREQESRLLAIENGTEAYAAQERIISNLRSNVEEIRGKRNTAFVLHQSKEKFAAELEIHETTQRKLRDNQRMWITALRSDTEERIVTFRSRLEAMKAASDQDVARNLDDLGSEVDRRNAEYMAAVGAASDRLRMEKIEKHPKRIQEIARIAAAQAEALAKVRMREQQAIDEFRNKYGIDPTQSSFFFHETQLTGEGAGGAQPDPSGAGGSAGPGEAPGSKLF